MWLHSVRPQVDQRAGLWEGQQEMCTVIITPGTYTGALAWLMEKVHDMPANKSRTTVLRSSGSEISGEVTVKRFPFIMHKHKYK